MADQTPLKQDKIKELLEQLNEMEGQYLGKEVPGEAGEAGEYDCLEEEALEGGTYTKIFGELSEKSKFSEEKLSTDSSNSYDMTRYAELIKAILHVESEERFLPERSIADLSALPLKEYLDATVIPILIQALEYLGTYRPPEPINALCVYLLKYRDEFEESPEEEVKKKKPEKEPELPTEPQLKPEPKPEKSEKSEKSVKPEKPKSGKKGKK